MNGSGQYNMNAPTGGQQGWGGFGSASDEQIMALIALLAATGSMAGQGGMQAPSAQQFLQEQLTGSTDKNVPNWINTAFQGYKGRLDPQTGMPLAYETGFGILSPQSQSFSFANLIQNYAKAFTTFQNQHHQDAQDFQQRMGGDPATVQRQVQENLANARPVTQPAAAPAMPQNTAAVNAQLAPVPPALPANNPWNYQGAPTAPNPVLAANLNSGALTPSQLGTAANQALNNPALMASAGNVAGTRTDIGPGAAPNARNIGVTPNVSAALALANRNQPVTVPVTGGGTVGGAAPVAGPGGAYNLGQLTPAMAAANQFNTPLGTPSTVGQYAPSLPATSDFSSRFGSPTASMGGGLSGLAGGGGAFGGATGGVMSGIAGIGAGLSQMLTPVPHQVPTPPPMPQLPQFQTPTVGQNQMIGQNPLAGSMLGGGFMPAIPNFVTPAIYG